MLKKRNKRKNHLKSIGTVIRAHRANQTNQDNQDNNKTMTKHKPKRLKKYKQALRQKTTGVESTLSLRKTHLPQRKQKTSAKLVQIKQNQQQKQANQKHQEKLGVSVLGIQDKGTEKGSRLRNLLTNTKRRKTLGFQRRSLNIGRTNKVSIGHFKILIPN